MNDSSVSIASFNDHGSVFYDRFNLTANDENFGISGCVGWGYERIIYSILAQKGADFNSDYYKKFNFIIKIENKIYYNSSIDNITKIMTFIPEVIKDIIYTYINELKTEEILSELQSKINVLF